MVAGLRYAVPVALSILLVGCGQPADPPESQASRDAAQQAAARWTPEMKDKFKEAMKGHQMTAGGVDKAGGKK